MKNRDRDDKHKDAKKPTREGDVLGISDANPEFHIPAKPGSGHVKGIDVREQATGLGDVPQHSGAVGNDVGAGEGGPGPKPPSARPKQKDPNDEE